MMWVRDHTARAASMASLFVAHHDVGGVTIQLSAASMASPFVAHHDVGAVPILLSAASMASPLVSPINRKHPVPSP